MIPANDTVLRAARQLLQQHQARRLTDIAPPQFPQFAEATHAALQAAGTPFTLAEVRAALAQAIASIAADRGITAERLLDAGAPVVPTRRAPGAGVLGFQLGDRAGAPRAAVEGILRRDLSARPQNLAACVRRWATELGHPLSPLMERLLAHAEQAGVTLSASTSGRAGGAFDAATNDVRFDVDALIAVFAAGRVPLTPARLIEELVKHELIHAVIFARVPNYDYRAGRSIARREFDDGLCAILDRLKSAPAGRRAAAILAIINDPQRTDARTRPEELVTYALTDADFRSFVRGAGQMAPLLGHLNRVGLGMLIG